MIAALPSKPWETSRARTSESVGPESGPSALEMLDEIEIASFRFFWEQAGPSTGLVKDHALTSADTGVVPTENSVFIEPIDSERRQR